ncbi:olfactory receptor 4S2-like [Moschus berezovskii]|uniref:olfactory receptor 4S2-like n=1 Tax=Moschus berezovskii TaxID=68408 RepID=UPI00244381F2|nr:olfactory receptor 4S2-like [Moschus berezovskii]
MGNNVTEFILMGLSQNKDVQQLCFILFLFFYITLMTGNFFIIVTVLRSPNLRSPMYFFLSFLSFVDICYSSVTAPKLIIDFQVKDKRISFVGCMLQLFFSHLFGCTEIFILTVMAYDRYVAICKPLHYLTIMDWKFCSILLVFCWLGGFVHTLVQTMLTVQLPFCGPNLIDHYFCDVQPLLKLACTDTYVVGLIVVANSGMISLSSFVTLVGSYTVVLLSFKTRSSEGRRKALSTCASHIIVVILFFVPCLFMYLRPSTTFPEDKIVAVFYTIITPMLNPLIYTLRNMEVKNAMKRLWIKRDSPVPTRPSTLADKHSTGSKKQRPLRTKRDLEARETRLRLSVLHVVSLCGDAHCFLPLTSQGSGSHLTSLHAGTFTLRFPFVSSY